MKITVFTLNLLSGFAASAGAALSNSSSAERTVQSSYSLPIEADLPPYSYDPSTTVSSVVDPKSAAASTALTDGVKSPRSTEEDSSSSVTDTSNLSAMITPAPDPYNCNECHLYGGSVQIFKWAVDPGGNATGSTFVNSNNYTFTSPSIYVAFQSLYATNGCGDTVGPTFGITTLVFGQHQLSTGTAWFQSSISDQYNIGYTSGENPQVASLQDPSFTQADFNTPLVCVTSTTIISWYGTDFETTSTDGAILTTAEYTFDPCSPAISVPTQLFSVNSAWQTCLPGVNALCDPPYTLTPAANDLPAFGATTTPQSSVAPLTPTPTSSPKDPQPTVSSDPTPQSDEGTATAGQSPSPSDPPANSPSPNVSAQQAPTGSDSPPEPATTTHNDSPEPTPTNGPSNQGSASDGSPAPSTTVIIEPSHQSPSSSDPSEVPNPSNAADPSKTTPFPTVLTIGSSTLTANSASQFVYDGQTLSPGGSITAYGSVYSVPVAPTTAAQALPNVITIGSSTLTANSASEYVFGTQTLTPGGAVTVSGVLYSIADPTPTPPFPTVMTIGSSTIYANSNSVFVYGSQTLTPGEVITVSGSVYSAPARATSTTGLGGAIISVGGFGSSSTSPSPKSSSTGSSDGPVVKGGGNRNALNSLTLAIAVPLLTTILGVVLYC